MSYRLVGKIQVPDENTQDPVKNGLPKNARYGLDLKIIGPNGELDSEAVIAGGFSYKSRFGFKDRSGAEVVLFKGTGGSGERFPAEGGPEYGRHAGCEIPNPGYIEDGSGISAIFDSNGLRMNVNFKHVGPDEGGCYTAFAEVEGVGVAEFPHGDTICVGKAAARKHAEG